MDRKNFIAYSYVCDERKVAKYVLEIANIIFWDDCKSVGTNVFQSQDCWSSIKNWTEKRKLKIASNDNVR